MLNLRKTYQNNPKLLLTTTVVLLIISFVISRNLLYSKDENEKTKKAPTTNPAVLADVYVVKDKILQDEIHTTGTVNARQEVELVSEIAKKVTGIYAKEGTFVLKGALLFKLDDADLQAKRKTLALHEHLALLEEKRFRELRTSEAVNQQEYDKISSQLNILQAELEELDVQIEKTRIVAPFSGKLGLKKIDIGAYVTPAYHLASIQDVSNMEVLFTIPEKYASEVKNGQQIQFFTETTKDAQSAKVIATEAGTDQNTRSLKVLALAENKAGKLVPGTSATISFALHTFDNGKIVPTQALIPTPEGYSIFVIKNGVASSKAVKTGTRTKGTVHVLEGIEQGDSVITTNILRIGPGVPVQAATTE